MINIVNEENKTISKSRNLRGILRMASLQGVLEVVVSPRPAGQAELFVLFYGGLSCTTTFASFAVCEQWIRRPLFKDAAIHIN